MLGSAERPSVKIFACGENACTARSLRRPEGRQGGSLPNVYFMTLILNSGFNRPFHVEASFVSLAPTYFIISQSALTPLRLLSKPNPLRWASVWCAALRAACFSI